MLHSINVLFYFFINLCYRNTNYNCLLIIHSNKSYGSHKHRPCKDESHKGSMESLDGEEKKDLSKEDLEHEPGNYFTYLPKS